jgi:hypothetical protein
MAPDFRLLRDVWLCSNSSANDSVMINSQVDEQVAGQGNPPAVCGCTLKIPAEAEACSIVMESETRLRAVM